MSSQIFENVALQISKYQQLKDPSIKSGYFLLFDGKAPTEMQYVDYERNIKPLGSGEMINFKIYTMGYKPNITKVKLQIDSDSDPFFSGVYETDLNLFKILRDEQKLNFDFQQLPTILIKALNSLQDTQNSKMSATLLVYSDGKCKLTIWHSSQYKNIQVICLQLGQENQDNLQTKVAIKYQELRKKVLNTEERLAKIHQVIKEKNPSLLLQLTKTTQGSFKASR